MVTFTEEILNGKLYFFVSRLEKRLNVFLRSTIKQKQFFINNHHHHHHHHFSNTANNFSRFDSDVIQNRYFKIFSENSQEKIPAMEYFFYSIPPENIKKSFVNCSANTKKMKFSIKYFFSKCDQIYSFLPIWSHLLKISLTENFIFCAVSLN